MLGLAGALLAIVALAAPALAGGLAVVSLDEVPPPPNAGDEVTVGFTLMQHGVTPLLDEDVRLTGENSATGETVSATARPEGAPGHYVVSVTFPSEGTWKWRLTAVEWPMTAAGEMTPLAVKAAPAAAAAAAVPTPATAVAGIDPVFVLGGLLLAFLAGAFLGSFRASPARSGERPLTGERLATH
jgi:hypothetical protein